MSRAHEESGMNDGLPPRELGQTGLLANAMALGCDSMSNAYGARTDADRCRSSGARPTAA
jgi:hypothetical protein